MKYALHDIETPLLIKTDHTEILYENFTDKKITENH